MVQQSHRNASLDWKIMFAHASRAQNTARMPL
jgi:hypothetical protein